jgi:hypothetical protein
MIMKCPFFNRCRSSNWSSTLATDFYNKLGTADLLVISLQNITALIRRHSKIFLTDFENSRWHSKKKNLNGYFARSKRRKLRFRNRENRLPFQGANVKGSFSPSFNDNFDTKNGITKELNKQLLEIIKSIDL